ncbi:MAG: type II toxin-antitoxin system MqsA family antitoxin [Sulfuricellaceae bacterium]|nr:type II toxin-antitoxin system MqsA family antitoxin [Sulfuricellaceae bacterium]
MDNKTLCSLCGEGHMTPRTENTVTEYRGQQGAVSLQYAECDVCGSEIVGDAEGRANKRAVLSFRKTVDGLLTGEEIRAIREKYQLTQAQAAKLLGGGPVAFSKYENDDVAHSDAMDNLLRLVRRSEEAFWELVEEKQLGEILHRRPARVAHYAALDIVYVALTVRTEKPMPAQRANQLSYLTPHRSAQFEASQWMQ